MPDATNPQDLNRYAYVRNNPLRYTDPSGHACVEGTSYCVNSATRQTSGNLAGWTGIGGVTPGNRKKGNGGGGQNETLQEELKRFKQIPTYTQSDMILIEFSDYRTPVTPEEYRLLQNKNGDLDALMYYRMAGVTLAAVRTAQNLFPNQPGDNSPRNAFQHAYWNALMVQEFGGEFTEKFATAHEKGAGSIRESQFMDLHNNDVGRNIGLENPTAPSFILIAQVLQAGQNGELYVWDGNDIYFSNQCPMCTFP